jgi:hypothetical protein
VTEFTATAGQTSFSVASYTVGYIDVYRNGARLSPTDFTATTGTTVVLGTAATAGDTVVTESFYVSSVLNAIPNTAGSVSSSNIVSGVTLTSPTLTSPTITGTPVMGASVITSGTTVATTSGTSIDFTSLPSWIKRITVIFNGVSTNGSVNKLFQLGTSGGIVSSGYTSTVAITGPTTAGTSSTAGYIMWGSAASEVLEGHAIITNMGSNIWVFSSTCRITNSYMQMSSGSVTLSGTLDRIRLTTVATDTFDAGSINILYE